MRRRALLAALAAGGAGVAGCLGAPTGDDDGSPDGLAGADDGDGGSTPTPGTAVTSGDSPYSRTTSGRNAAPIARHGLPQDICEEEVSADPGIYAIDDPAFDADWAGYSVADYYGQLDAGTTVVGLERDGTARAYPVSVLWHHEIVNESLGGPVMVTYCPLCKSGLVADRTVDGAATTFVVSGLLWKPPALQVEVERDEGSIFGAGRRDADVRARRSGNLVMYDRATGSYWSQLIAQAICGTMAGTELGIVPSAVTTWGEWRGRYPDASVLVPPPHSGTVGP